MGVFTRFKDIISANINHLLDKAEDPEKMIRLMIREMEATLVDLKQNCAEQMAIETRKKHEVGELQEQSARWQSRAELAVAKGRDELAKEALHHYNNCKANLEQVQGDCDSLAFNIAELKQQVVKVQEKLTEVKNKQLVLVQRAKTASHVQRSNEVLQRSSDDAYARFAELESKVELWEARATSSGLGQQRSTEQEFAELESNSQLDEQLEELKKNMQGSDIEQNAN